MVRSGQVSLGGCARVTFSRRLIEDPRIEPWLKVFEDRLPKLLHYAIALVPEDWYKDDIRALYARLLWRLENIRALVNHEVLGATRNFEMKNITGRGPSPRKAKPGDMIPIHRSGDDLVHCYRYAVTALNPNVAQEIRNVRCVASRPSGSGSSPGHPVHFCL